MKKMISLVALCIFVFLVFAGCSAGAQPITGAERDAVLAYAEPKTENLLNGFNAGDYAIFARDFDAAMRQAETETVFTQTRAAIQNKIGNYISRQVTNVVKQDKFIVVIYNGRFENEDGVTMRVVFTPDDAHQITGLWFDSPKLRQK
jgi:hypothetical protein